MAGGGPTLTSLASRLDDWTLVTGNEDKRREAERILGRPLRCEALDLPEIQGLDLLEVARAKGREAFRRLGSGVIVEETGLELQAMNGFPGPLVKWMLSAIGPRGIARTALALGEAGVRARCAILAYDGSREVVAVGVTEGTLVETPRGDGGFGWDPVFVPEGESLTYGELDGRTKDRIGHRGRAWREFLRELDRLAEVSGLAQSSLRT